MERPVKESVYESLESLSWKFGYDAIKPLGILERESIKEKSNEKVFTKKKQ